MTNRFQVLVSLTVAAVYGVARLFAAEPTAFEQRVAEANRLLDQGKLQEALVAVKAAAALDTNRFEAPFLAAVIFLELKAPEPARAALNSAVALAPANQRPKLDALRQALAALEPPQARAATVATPTNALSMNRTPHPTLSPSDGERVSGGRERGNEQGSRSPCASTSLMWRLPTNLTAAARRQYDTLVLIIEEADKATLAEERKKLLREFLEKSEAFLKGNPEQMPIWTLRAVSALELDQGKSGWEAGQQMLRLGAESSGDPKTRKVVAQLDRRGWLAENYLRNETEKEAIKAREESAAAERERVAREVRGRFEGTFVSDWQPASFSRHKFQQVSFVISNQGTILMMKRYRDKPGGIIHLDDIPALGWEKPDTSIDPATRQLIAKVPSARFALDDGGQVLSVDLPDDLREHLGLPATFRELRREK